MKGIARLFQDPLILVDRSGALLDLNGPARRLLGDLVPTEPAALPPGHLFAALDGLRDLLVQASGTAEPALGAVLVPQACGERRRYRARAVMHLRTGTERQFAVQFLDTGDDGFSILTQRVKELNQEIVSRRNAQAQLEEALAHNRVLYRELQHRVKNHLQMMLGLFSAARREAVDPARRAVIENLELKLRAICEAQQLMYLNEDTSSLPAADLLNSLAQAYQIMAGNAVRITTEADPVHIPNDAAFALALIVNELLSNALKYGVADTGSRILASLRRVGDEFELKVRDNGPGFTMAEPARRSSGLGLVRGLCRQLGGKLEISSDGGAQVAVRFAGLS